jgi:putative nucleotidyltransferase with HDIG domain
VNDVRASQVISALSYALDLAEGQTPGHSAQSCMIGMRIAAQIGMPAASQADLYYALLLKDAGCSSNASRLFQIIHADEIRAKGDLKDKDWTRIGWESLQYAVDHVAPGAPFLERMRRLILLAVRQRAESRELVKIRCERGSSIARRMGFSDAVCAGIQSLDEHWNGRGYPDGLRGDAIPLFSRIMNLAQTLAVFMVQHGRRDALEIVEKRSKRWFDPDLVKAAQSLANSGALWAGVHGMDLVAQVAALEPEERRLMASERSIDNICQTFAEVIDAKSPFTYRHSIGVAEAAVSVATQLGMGKAQVASLRRAALLHDIGKLSVPNSILEKPAKLDGREWDVVKKHPYYTLQILRRVPGFADLSDVAATHHERLDGRGYWRNWGAGMLNTPARILAVADVFEALSARRPYRDGLPIGTVFAMIEKDAPRALDPECVEALKTSALTTSSLERGPQDLVALSESLGRRSSHDRVTA